MHFVKQHLDSIHQKRRKQILDCHHSVLNSQPADQPLFDLFSCLLTTSSDTETGSNHKLSPNTCDMNFITNEIKTVRFQIFHNLDEESLDRRFHNSLN